MKPIAWALGLLLASAANAAPVTLVGDTVDAAIIRTVDDGFYPVGRITGYGLDAPFTVVDGDADLQDYLSTFTLNVDGDRFTLQFVTSAGWQPGIVFRLTDLDFSPAGGGVLSSLGVDTNLVGYSLTVDPHSVEIGLGDTHFDENTYFIGTFITSSPSTVPEPASAALLAMGLAGLTVVARRQPRAQPHRLRAG